MRCAVVCCLVPSSMFEVLILKLFRHWNDTASWEEQFAGTKSLTRLTDRLAKIAPETGAYLNEVSRLFCRMIRDNSQPASPM